MFKLESLTIKKGAEWQIYKCEIDFESELYKKAVEQSELKAKYTRNESQSGSQRNEITKYQNQLRGTIAEIYCQYYLKQVLPSDVFDILRYDDIRTDGFKSPKNEFDIKIVNKQNQKEFTVESRSSVTYKRTLLEAINNYDIIGYYKSTMKTSEKPNDFYLRPLYDNKRLYKNEEFETNLKNGNISLYIVAGCHISNLKAKGYDSSMGQGNTTYRVIKIADTYDVMAFEKRLHQYLKRDKNK